MELLSRPAWLDNIMRLLSYVSLTNVVTLSYQQDADKKGLATITDDVKLLAGKARSNTLKPKDYEVSSNRGLVFSVKLLGVKGGEVDATVPGN